MSDNEAKKPPEAVTCPFCNRPALQICVGEFKLLGCKCIPKDTFYAINLDTLRTWKEPR